ncbi:hypothetical protein HYPSUDRAFT_185870 [Hypholoma sublateritium FD-334 SS-4]|uniref:DUF6593 domain-containing protein n=1 Tax=Hypholoma sublateritium (strain FD-334 SS-4) TaxID=945553 RepID=A0A0D2L702_HYPSF|nr:hypothetical protein HYPSUDRAFT_185870 [Hypholoma sublateritium FD-334 SS-4]
MYTNPFSSAWGSPESRESNGWSSVGSVPPTFGVLPSMEDIPSAMIFTFNMPNSSILNCSVFGSNAAPYFTITTNSTSTTIHRRSGEVFAVINWQSHPTIQARGVLDPQRTAQWLRLSQDRKRRNMVVNGRAYTWYPRGNAICLHGTDTSAAGEIARITRANNSVTLQLSISAFNSGFFETSILATILFLSGRDID